MEFDTPVGRRFAGPDHDLRRERRLMGPDGREWRVREIPMPSYDRRGGRCLVFETNDAARRVRQYPARWYDCDDSELYTMSLHA